MIRALPNPADRPSDLWIKLHGPPSDLAQKEAHAIKTGNLSIETLFNASPGFDKMYADAWPKSAPAPKTSQVRLVGIGGSHFVRPTMPARPSALSTAQDFLRTLCAGVGSLLAAPPAAPQTPWPSSRLGLGASQPWGTPSGLGRMAPHDPRHPAVTRFLPIVLAMAAGGLVASAMIGAGLVSAPATGLTILCSALLGVWFAVLAFREAAQAR